MPEKKPESTLLAICPKCNREIQLDISAPLKSITDVFKLNEEEKRKVIEKVLKEMRIAQDVAGSWLKRSASGRKLVEIISEWIKILEGLLKSEGV